jgi:proline iminopeptidase
MNHIMIPETFIIQSGNCSIEAKLYSRTGADTVILLHGGPGVPDEMTEVRETLNQKYQVITFDQRGTGKGDHRNCTYTIADYLQDINIVAGFFKLTAFHLFGHSWGGLYAQLYASENPEKILSLFLCSPASGCGPIVWKMTEREVLKYVRYRSTSLEWFGMGINSLLGMLGSDKACRRLFRTVIINYHKGYPVDPPDPEKLARINAAPVNRTRPFIASHPPLSSFGRTNYPVIVTYGDDDAYGKSREYVYERFPEARFELIPECGHTAWKHNPTAFQKLLNDFYSI